MTFDALSALRAAGNPVDLLTEGQRAVLGQLTEEEVAVLNRLRNGWMQRPTTTSKDTALRFFRGHADGAVTLFAWRAGTTQSGGPGNPWQGGGKSKPGLACD